MTTQVTEYFDNYLIDQIEMRYSLMRSRESGSKNGIIDGDYPRLLVNYIRNNEVQRLASTTKAITEHVSNELNVELIPTKDLIEMLGYTEKKIWNLIRAVKKLKYFFVFVGFGGVGTSTNYWLIKLMELTNQSNLFEKVYVYDDDKIEYSNTVRFPMSIHTTSTKDKAMLFSNRRNISSKKPEINTHKLHSWGVKEISNKAILPNNWNQSKHNATHDKIVFFGAPDLETRDMLKDKAFLMATHGGDTVSLMTQPTIDTNIQVESYGMVKLNIFHMNMLRMTIGLLEFLSNPNMSKWGHQEFLDFNFAQYATETDLFNNSRYNMKIDHTGILGEVA